MPTNPSNPPSVSSFIGYPSRLSAPDPITYQSEVETADAEVLAFKNEINASAQNVYDNSVVTFNNATESVSSASTAITQAGIATTKAGEASASAALAEDWATSTTVVAGGLKGAKGYAEDAAASVAVLPAGTINDALIALDKTWSSQKISDIGTANELKDQSTLSADFATSTYQLDDGDKLVSSDALDLFTVTSSPKVVQGPNGLLRTVPAGSVAREWRDGVCQGVLIEEQRTNLLLRSSEFDNETWIKVRLTISSDITIAPDGTLTADKVIPTTESASAHYIYNGVTISTGVVYTMSVYAKAAEYNFIRLTSFTSPHSAVFNLSTGAVGTTTAATSTLITPVGDGWYRCSVTFTSTLTGNNNVGFYATPSDSESPFSGDGTSGIYIWGAQLEEGSIPTSYIPTTNAQVTRLGDSVSRGLAAEFSSDEGTLYIDAIDPVAPPVVGYVLGIGSGLTVNYIGLQPHRGRAYIFGDFFTIPEFSAGLDGPCCISYNRNENWVKIACKGVVSTFNPASFNLPTTVDIAIGALSISTATKNITNHRDLKYIPRALSDDELILLTV